MSGAETSDPAHARQYGKDGAHLPTWGVRPASLGDMGLGDTGAPGAWMYPVVLRRVWARLAQGKVGLYSNTNGDSSSPHKTRRMRERLVHGEVRDVPESKRGQEYSA